MTPPRRCKYSAVRFDTNAPQPGRVVSVANLFSNDFNYFSGRRGPTHSRDNLAQLSQHYWVCGTQDGRPTKEKKTHRDAQESPVKESDL